MYERATGYPSNSTILNVAGHAQHCRQSRPHTGTRTAHIDRYAICEAHTAVHTSVLDRHHAIEKHADTRDRTGLAQALGQPRVCFEGSPMLAGSSQQLTKLVKKRGANFFYAQGFLVIQDSAVFFLEAIRFHLQGERIDLPLPKPLCTTNLDILWVDAC